MAAGPLPPSDGVTRNPAQQLNRVARRDPQLYPLLAIMLGIAGVGGYFLTRKASDQVKEPAHHLMSVNAHPASPQNAMGPPVVAGSRVDQWKKQYQSAKPE